VRPGPGAGPAGRPLRQRGDGGRERGQRDRDGGEHDGERERVEERLGEEGEEDVGEERGDADRQRLAARGGAGAGDEQARPREHRAAGGREHERAGGDRGERQEEVAVARRVRPERHEPRDELRLHEPERQRREPEDADPRRGGPRGEVAGVVEHVGDRSCRIRRGRRTTPVQAMRRVRTAASAGQARRRATRPGQGRTAAAARRRAGTGRSS
jgi:hypothetical protein